MLWDSSPENSGEEDNFFMRSQANIILEDDDIQTPSSPRKNKNENNIKSQVSFQNFQPASKTKLNELYVPEQLNSAEDYNKFVFTQTQNSQKPQEPNEEHIDTNTMVTTKPKKSKKRRRDSKTSDSKKNKHDKKKKKTNSKHVTVENIPNKCEDIDRNIDILLKKQHFEKRESDQSVSTNESANKFTNELFSQFRDSHNMAKELHFDNMSHPETISSVSIDTVKLNKMKEHLDEPRNDDEFEKTDKNSPCLSFNLSQDCVDEFLDKCIIDMLDSSFKNQQKEIANMSGKSVERNDVSLENLKTKSETVNLRDLEGITQIDNGDLRKKNKQKKKKKVTEDADQNAQNAVDILKNDDIQKKSKDKSKKKQAGQDVMMNAQHEVSVLKDTKMKGEGNTSADTSINEDNISNQISTKDSDSRKINNEERKKKKLTGLDGNKNAQNEVVSPKKDKEQDEIEVNSALTKLNVKENNISTAQKLQKHKVKKNKSKNRLKKDASNISDSTNVLPDANDKKHKTLNLSDHEVDMTSDKIDLKKDKAETKKKYLNPTVSMGEEITSNIKREIDDCTTSHINENQALIEKINASTVKASKVKPKKEVKYKSKDIVETDSDSSVEHSPFKFNKTEGTRKVINVSKLFKNVRSSILSLKKPESSTSKEIENKTPGEIKGKASVVTNMSSSDPEDVVNATSKKIQATPVKSHTSTFLCLSKRETTTETSSESEDNTNDPDYEGRSPDSCARGKRKVKKAKVSVKKTNSHTKARKSEENANKTNSKLYKSREYLDSTSSSSEEEEKDISKGTNMSFVNPLKKPSNSGSLKKNNTQSSITSKDVTSRTSDSDVSPLSAKKKSGAKSLDKNRKLNKSREYLESTSSSSEEEVEEKSTDSKGTNNSIVNPVNKSANSKFLTDNISQSSITSNDVSSCTSESENDSPCAAKMTSNVKGVDKSNRKLYKSLEYLVSTSSSSEEEGKENINSPVSSSDTSESEDDSPSDATKKSGLVKSTEKSESKSFKFPEHLESTPASSEQDEDTSKGVFNESKEEGIHCKKAGNSKKHNNNRNDLKKNEDSKLNTRSGNIKTSTPKQSKPINNKKPSNKTENKRKKPSSSTSSSEESNNNPKKKLKQNEKEENKNSNSGNPTGNSSSEDKKPEEYQEVSLKQSDDKGNLLKTPKKSKTENTGLKRIKAVRGKAKKNNDITPTSAISPKNVLKVFVKQDNKLKTEKKKATTVKSSKTNSKKETKYISKDIIESDSDSSDEQEGKRNTLENTNENIESGMKTSIPKSSKSKTVLQTSPKQKDKSVDELNEETHLKSVSVAKGNKISLKSPQKLKPHQQKHNNKKNVEGDNKKTPTITPKLNDKIKIDTTCKKSPKSSSDSSEIEDDFDPIMKTERRTPVKNNVTIPKKALLCLSTREADVDPDADIRTKAKCTVKKPVSLSKTGKKSGIDSKKATPTNSPKDNDEQKLDYVDKENKDIEKSITSSKDSHNLGSMMGPFLENLKQDVKEDEEEPTFCEQETSSEFYKQPKRRGFNHQFQQEYAQPPVGEEVIISRDEEELLRYVVVNMDFKVSPLHMIGRQLSKPPTKGELALIKEKKLVIRNGFYTPDETQTIIDNFEKFCRVHNFPQKPELFISRKSMPIEEYLNFMRYLANGLPRRSLWSVYKRFRTIYLNVKRGKYSPEEDKLILETIATTKDSHHIFARLGRELNREPISIVKHYMRLREQRQYNLKDGNTALSDEDSECLLKCLMQETELTDVNDLKNKHLPLPTFAKISEEMHMRPLKLQQHWLNNLHPRLFVTGSRDYREVKAELIDLVLANPKNTSIYHLNYNEYIPIMDGWTTLALGKIVKNMLKSATETYPNITDFREKLIALRKDVLNGDRVILKRARFENNVLIVE